MSPRHKMGELVSIGTIPTRVESLHQIVLNFVENQQIDSLLIHEASIRRIRADLHQPGRAAFVFGDHTQWDSALAEDRLKPSSIELLGITKGEISAPEVLLGRIKVLPINETNIWADLEVLESGARDSLMLLATHLRQVFGMASNGETTKQREKAAARPRSRKQRKRGPNMGTIEKCKTAMRLWLDNGQSLTAASQTAGTYPETVRRWMRNVLKTVDKETQARWTRQLRALEELNEF